MKVIKVTVCVSNFLKLIKSFKPGNFTYKLIIGVSRESINVSEEYAPEISS